MRESGYYWILINDEWEIGKYDNKTDSWSLCGDSRSWHPEEINEKRLFY